MLLSDWYFCSSVQMRAREATALMEALAIVRDPSIANIALMAAIEYFMDSEDLNQIYALPQLVERLYREDSELDALVATSLREAIRAAIGPMPAQLSHLLDSIPGRPPRDLADAVRNLPQSKAVSPVSSPYLDLPDLSIEVFLLSLVREVARRDRAAGDSLVRGSRQLAVVELARTGSLGRLPLMLAIESLACSGEPRESWMLDITSALRGGKYSWAGQPDLIDLVTKLENVDEGRHDEVEFRIGEGAGFSRLAHLLPVVPRRVV